MSLTDGTTFNLEPLFLERIGTVDSSNHCYVLESTFRLHRKSQTPLIQASIFGGHKSTILLLSLDHMLIKQSQVIVSSFMPS
jgi:hypothetical protein